MKTNTYTLPAAIVAAAIMVLAFSLLFKQTNIAAGSVNLANEYQGTTTVSTPGFFPADAVLSNTNGSLAQVVITGAAGATISLYDATTSNIALRAPSMSSSSILLASFPANATAETYEFDRRFYNGLYISISGGITPTSTITFR